MILATSMPQYRATVVIKPVKEDMKITHYRQSEGKGIAIMLLALWAIITVAYYLV